MIVLPRGLPLARLDTLSDPGAVVIDIEHAGAPVSLILTRTGDRIAAFRNRCPHAGHPLQRADGRIAVQQGRYMVCGGHGASFTLDEGACAGGPCNGDHLERVDIDLREGVVITR